MRTSIVLRVVLPLIFPSLVLAAAPAKQTEETATVSAASQPAAATASANAEVKPVLDTESKISYSIGVNMGDNLRQQDISVNIEAFMQGFKDALTKNHTLLTPEEMRQVLVTFQEQQHKKFETKMKTAAVKNLNDGKAFLDANKSKPGVITLASGLQYKVLNEGSGTPPKLTDSVTVNYRGTLINGTEFDSSEKHGQAATFPVNAVIPGWTEALQLMKPGAKWTLYIPSNLAYGEAGAGRLIEPNSTLIFDVDLLSVNSSADKAKPAAKEDVKSSGKATGSKS